MRNTGSAWFRAEGEAWHPSLYEWWFRRTATGRRLRGAEQRAVTDSLLAVLKPEHRVLEVGSGTGHYTCLLDEMGAQVVARDASEPMTHYLRRRLDREKPRFPMDVGLGSLPDSLNVTGPFDGILAIGVLNYVEGFRASLAAFAGLLAPGGWVVFSVPPDDHNGRVYRRLERLGRRRIYLRSVDEVHGAAAAAGLSMEDGPDVASVMAVYRGARDERGTSAT